ncbi:MAG: O-sialoglycoprotein endopeptidase [Desulfitobacteriaceae bacterium]|nr:O-sialoglycoprotein endopeptidase [Desulfitobacteriaceae bacterium]MDI6879608.1 O-sialoglycoprotein endopeptidase [Desulfitobacteriaceae bacterium]MDI6912977.1 O-sialoglycoprotein endopeptidase [Desulfitobacteriaceae bacterium]
MYYLGLDTSAYTTSLALIGEEGVAWEKRQVLEVPAGETGLAQSTAFFQHVQNLPRLVAEVPSYLWKGLVAVGVSTAPRPVPGSYMPVFTAGLAVAQAIAAARQVPLMLTSHQEGHIAAGLVSAGGPEGTDFLVVHLSGGTTELLAISQHEPGSVNIRLLGGTTDLHAGQFVDRVGVRLGLGFPSGKELEKLAQGAAPGAESLLPSSIRGFELSFSGVETAAQRLLEQGTPAADVARAVEGCIARTVAKLVERGLDRQGLSDVLLVGGVSANQFIRQALARRLGQKARLYWAEPDWSRDNALGVAYLTKKGSTIRNIF